MPLALTKRIPTGSPLTAAQNDANMTAIENAVNATQTQVTGIANGSTTNYTKAQTDTAIATAISGIPSPGSFNSHPAFANAPGSQTITADGAAVTVTLNAAPTNPGGDFNTGTSTYTAPVTGHYRVSGTLAIDNGTADAPTLTAYVSPSVNGGGFPTVGATAVASPPGSHWFAGFSVILSVSAGDAITLKATITDGVGTGTVTVTSATMAVDRLST